MPKKTKTAKTKTEKKPNGNRSDGTEFFSKAPNGKQEPKARPLLRAIRVSREVLEAAKAYKRDKGISFYKLGLEAITERLVREGYLPSQSSVQQAVPTAVGAGTKGAPVGRDVKKLSEPKI